MPAPWLSKGDNRSARREGRAASVKEAQKAAEAALLELMRERSARSE